MALILNKCLAFHNYFIIILIIMIFITCSEDKPTSPEENDNTDITTITIGSAGGEISDENFALIIPGGCFQEEIQIGFSTTDNYFLKDENSASETYLVSGIPSNFAKPIKIALKYNGSLTDSSFIALAATEVELFLNDSLYAFNYLSVEDSSGYLVAEISSSMLNNLSLNKNRTVYNSPSDHIQIMLQIIPSLKVYRYNNIEIYFPASKNTEAINFAQRMNYILNLFVTDFGFDFKFNNSFQENNVIFTEAYQKWQWPARFFIIEKLNQTTAKLAGNIFDDNRYNITTPVGWLNESESRQTSFKFSFQLIDLLENSFNGKQLTSQENFFKALRLWFETYLYPLTYEDPPSYLASHGQAFFKGFYNVDISIELATIIKYLVDYLDFDVSNFGSIFEEAHANNTSHYFSLVSKVDNLIMDWFPDYYEKYINGEIFNLSSAAFLPSVIDWNINQESDTLYETTQKYDDLSAKRFVINLNYEFEDDSTSLILEAYKSTAANNDGVATLVYSADASNNLEHLVTSRAQPIEIPNLKSYYQYGTRKFLVVVVNTINDGVDFTGQSEISLVAKTKIDEEEKVPDFNLCGIAIYCGARHVYSTPESSYETSNNKVGFGTWTRYTGGFSGNTFTGTFIKTWDSSTNPLTISGSMSIVFNKDYSEILTINWSETSESQSIPNGISGSSTTTFSGKNIPLDTYEWGTVYQVKMEETCDHIELFTDTQSSTNGNNYSMPEYWCNGDSKVYISFSKE